jgi:uncharacterized membrane protein
MNKQEFLARLREGLRGLPRSDAEERLAFYSEMIDDRMEEGLSEESAVSAIGSVEEVASQIIADIPLLTLVRERVTPKKKLGTWEIVLLALGSPIWLSLALAALAVLLALYASVWSLVASLWAIFVSFACVGPCAVAMGIVFAVRNGIAGFAMIGSGIFALGLAIVLFFGCKTATAATVILTKKIALGFKRLFMKKEEA